MTQDSVDLAHVSHRVFPGCRLSAGRAGEGDESVGAVTAPHVTGIRVLG